MNSKCYSNITGHTVLTVTEAKAQLEKESTWRTLNLFSHLKCWLFTFKSLILKLQGPVSGFNAWS